jgi:anthranilate synthase component 2
MKILVLDNYDSFTYNLVHILRKLGHDELLEVHRNDKIALDDVQNFDKILLSPGPGVPSEAGIMPKLIQKYGPSKSILGICLGHQAIGEAFGGEIYNMTEVLHGIATPVQIVDKEESLFSGLPLTFNVCRYHSWSIVEDKLPEQLVVTALDEQGRIMGVRHKQHNVSGLQFHPESILTEHGEKMIENWLNN